MQAKGLRPEYFALPQLRYTYQISVTDWLLQQVDPLGTGKVSDPQPKV